MLTTVVFIELIGCFNPIDINYFEWIWKIQVTFE